MLMLCLFLIQGTFCTSPYPATDSEDTSREVDPAELTPIGEISQELNHLISLENPAEI